MTDLEIKLRTNAVLAVSHVPLSENILLHAADEIEKLRAEKTNLLLRMKDHDSQMDGMATQIEHLNAALRVANENIKREEVLSFRNQVAQLEAERDAAVATLRGCKTYIEIVEVTLDAEVGKVRNLAEIISAGDMPELYEQVCAAIDAARGEK